MPKHETRNAKEETSKPNTVSVARASLKFMRLETGHRPSSQNSPRCNLSIKDLCCRGRTEAMDQPTLPFLRAGRHALFAFILSISFISQRSLLTHQLDNKDIGPPVNSGFHNKLPHIRIRQENSRPPRICCVSHSFASLPPLSLLPPHSLSVRRSRRSPPSSHLLLLHQPRPPPQVLLPRVPRPEWTRP
jgi:hypothetical protein